MARDPSVTPQAAAAMLLYRHLRGKARSAPVALATLQSIFETCYFASLQGEERRPTVITLAFIDPKTPDPDRPKTIRPQRWTVHRLSSKLDLTVRNLVKLAPSASPSSTLLAVFAGVGVPYVWGLVDQQTDFRQAFDRERHDVGHFPRPGLFQLEIDAPGRLRVLQDMTHVLTVHESTLITEDSDVLHRGPVAAILTRYLASCGRRAIHRLALRIPKKAMRPANEHVQLMCRSLWIASLSRIILRIQRRKHGGALLIAPGATMSGLNCKYQLEYHRLESVLMNHAIAAARNHRATLLIRKGGGHPQSAIPAELYYERIFSQNVMDDCIDAETGCVSFIASLANVDGLVLLQRGLRVAAFGVEVTRRVDPKAL